MTKVTFLYFILGILPILAIVTSYPVSKYGARFAQLVSRVNSYPQQVILSQQLCNGARLSFGDSSDSSSEYRTSQCTFHILTSYGLYTQAKIPRRQTDSRMLAMQAPSVSVASTMKPGGRFNLGATSPLTILKVTSSASWPTGSSVLPTFTPTKPFSPDFLSPRSAFPTIITRESAPTATTAPPTTKEPRGDA